MFAQPKPKLNMRAVIRDVLDEEQELLLTLGQDFLASRLGEAEDRLSRWERYLADRYPDGETPPRGDAQQLQTFRAERALIQQLTTQAQTQPFPVVHHRALEEARRRVQRLLATGPWTADTALRAQRRQARLEQELLIELWSKWHEWVQPRTLHDPKP